MTLRNKLIDSINKTVDEKDMLCAEAIADGIIIDSICVDVNDARYNEICLCWNFYTFLIDSRNEQDCGNFIMTYGLDYQYALDVAIEENVEIKKQDMSFIMGQIKKREEYNRGETEG